MFAYVSGPFSYVPFIMWKLRLVANNKYHPNNRPIYYVEIEIGSSILFIDLSFEEKVPKTDLTIKDKLDQQTKEILDKQNSEENEMWNMSFDGVVNREGAWAGVWINPPKSGTKLCP
jgi:hypothetical protein